MKHTDFEAPVVVAVSNAAVTFSDKRFTHMAWPEIPDRIAQDL